MTEIRTVSSTGGAKGVKLARFDLIPVGPLTELAEHYGVGASKYANHQWRQGYEWSKSYSALMRHLTAFWAGYDFDVCSNDPEGCSHIDAEGEPFVAVREDACFNHTGSHHLAAVAWHSFTMLEFKDEHPDHDDRYKVPVEVGPREFLDPELWENVGYLDEDEAKFEPFAMADLTKFQEQVNRMVRNLADVMERPRIIMHHAWQPPQDASFVKHSDAINAAHNGTVARG